MKLRFISISSLLTAAMVFISCHTAKNSCSDYIQTGMKEPTCTLLLYPDGQSSDRGITENGVAITLGPQESNGITESESVNEVGNISNVGDSARIVLYLPEKRNGQMVIVCPGGGYSILSSKNEGTYVAEWMTSRGISVCTVLYRMPKGHHRVPLTDVQNAFRYCRAHAEEWGINQIGVMGFSAGGHLAASASTLYTDAVTRPDFSVLIYPVITLSDPHLHRGTMKNLVAEDPDLRIQYSLENHIDANTPPAILLLSGDDSTVPPTNSIMYFQRLKEFGVQAQMHIFPRGGHGWGFTTSEYGTDWLGEYRPLFFECLDSFFADIQPKSE